MTNWATAQELRSRMNSVTTLNDLNLEAILTAAQNTISRFCNRPDGFLAATTATTRLYAGSGNGYLSIDETPEITAVGVKSSTSDTVFTAWAATDWIAFKGSSRFPNFNKTPYEGLMVSPNGDYSYFRTGSRRGFPMVQITAKWGYALTIPEELKEASIMQAIQWFKREEGAMTTALASGDLGMLLYNKAVDPAVAMILVEGRYKKPVVGIG